MPKSNVHNWKCLSHITVQLLYNSKHFLKVSDIVFQGDNSSRLSHFFV